MSVKLCRDALDATKAPPAGRQTLPKQPARPFQMGILAAVSKGVKREAQENAAAERGAGMAEKQRLKRWKNPDGVVGSSALRPPALRFFPHGFARRPGESYALFVG